MNGVYRGHGVEPGRAARLKKRRYGNGIKGRNSRTPVYIAVFLIVACVLGTRVLIAGAGRLKAEEAFTMASAENISLTNRINAVNYEINREINPDNMMYVAQVRLGMSSGK